MRTAALIAACAALAALAAVAWPPEVGAKPRPPLPCKFKGDNKYPGDDAPKAVLAQWLAQGAAKAKLPPELPVMAALVESNVRNLDFGDADSVGFFQMRVSIWNAGPYLGFPDDPQLQLQWFIDQALAVREQRLAAGASPLSFLDPAAYGEWIADVIRPPEQYRGRYQLRLDEARALICG